MPPTVNEIVLLSLALYVLVIVVEAVRSRDFGSRLWRQVAGILIAASALHWVTGFPFARQAFGADVALWQILLTAICVILGIAANGAYYHSGTAWAPILKPLLLSPIVVGPLIMIINPEASKRDAAVFYCVAFQNGFFWRSVFKNAKPKPLNN